MPRGWPRLPRAGGAAVRVRMLGVLLRPTPPPLGLGLVVSALLIVAETLVLYPLEQVAPASSLAVVYLLGIMVVAVMWGLRLAAAVSVVSAAAFDYFHVPPLFDLTPARAEDTVALGIFLVVALLTGTLADVARSRAAEADLRRKADLAAAQTRVLAEQQTALRRVATLVARGVSPAEVFAAVAAEMAHCLEVPIVSVLRYEPDGAVTVVASYSAPGVQDIPAGERLALKGNNIAATVLRTGHTARMDSLANAAGSWAAQARQLGMLSGVGAPVVVGEGVWGVAVVGSSRLEPLPPDTEERIGDFADLVATALANAATRDELIASRERIVAAADDARRRLERDLHDGAQQRLVALSMQARMAEGAVPAEFDDLRNQLSDLACGLSDVSTELREISRGIHPAILSEGGLALALKSLGRRSTVPVSFDVAIERRLTDAVQVAAYYVVAEALTNVAKHAQASRVELCAQTTDAALRLSIQDDGIGGADFHKGSGLIGLKDRVEVVGGQMRVTSLAGSGTLIDITIPLDSP